MNHEDLVVKKLDVISKLLCMQTRPRIEQLKKDLIKTEIQKKAYELLDGKKTIKEIAQATGYKSTRTLEEYLPEWESRGLILGLGKGSRKRYVNIENLEV